MFKYEEAFLNWAIDQDWLGVMKSCIQLLGFYPNNLLGPPQPPPDPSLLDEVRSKIESLFPDLFPHRLEDLGAMRQWARVHRPRAPPFGI